MIHKDGADRGSEELRRAKGGVGVEKNICAVVEY